MGLTQINTQGIEDGQVFTADIAPFAVTAEKLASDALDHRIIVGVAGGNAAYTFLGEGCNSSTQNPTLYLTRGKTYQFSLSYGSALHPFRIQSTAGTSGTEYNTGVTNNGGGGGSTVIFEVPHDAPAQLYYQCTSHAAMNGSFLITGKIADSIITSSNLADQAVTLAKLPHGTSSNNGKFLRANNGADPTFETVNTDLVSDTSPQLGGDLDTNSHNINLDDDHSIKFGDDNDLVIKHSGSNANIENITGDLVIRTLGSGDDIFIDSKDDVTIRVHETEVAIECRGDGAVELYYDGNKKAETVTGGFTVTGTCTATAFAGDGSALTGIQGIPSGVIVIWSGAENAIPSGWYLCDGTNNTPNLTERFIVGAGGGGNSSVSSNAYSVGATGGNVTVTSGAGNAFGTAYNWPAGSPNELGVNNRGHTHPVDVLPPYYALCYIMKS
jgi:hypothetical protein